ncbi:hypothetical protein RHSIM_Rhsim05G0139900 [Rhododendron simsii]|uniref:Uncharacterized protein n=1 Tax=Rhododendron simsii TaxID=118357 RepID=A0A834GWN9_RHOSS|nr:hypothetical protein RHSIM_Rhsim05G0139900 [Rhododendron simsii]
MFVIFAKDYIHCPTMFYYENGTIENDTSAQHKVDGPYRSMTGGSVDIQRGNPLGDDESFDHDECKKVQGSPTPKPKKDYIQARISLRSIVKIISKLSLEQSEAIREIGLGGLLGLRCMKQDHILTRWLIKNFDPESSLMDVHGQQLLFTPVEVHNVLGIQCEGKDIKLKGCVPTTKPALRKSYLHAVKNVEAVKECNWAKLTLDFLIGSIRKCKQKGHLRANGCLLLLVLFFLDHVTTKETHTPCPRSTPSLAHWGDAKISGTMSLLGDYQNKKVNMKFTHIEKQNQASPENTNFEEQNQESSNDEGFEEHKQPSPKTTCICNDSRIAKVESELVEFKKSFVQYRYDDNQMTKVEKGLTEMKMIFIENHCDGDRIAKVETELVGMNCLPFQPVEEVNVKSLVKKQPAQGLKRARTFGMADLNTISAGVDVETDERQQKATIRKVNMDEESELDSDDVKCQKISTALDLLCANLMKSLPQPKPIPPHPLSSDEKALVAYCFDKELDRDLSFSETIVSLVIDLATRRDLCSLKPGVWDNSIHIQVHALHLMLQTKYGHFYVADVTMFDWITLEDPPIQDNLY